MFQAVVTENEQSAAEHFSLAPWSEAELVLLAEIGRSLSASLDELAESWTEKVYPLAGAVLSDSARLKSSIVAVHRTFLRAHFRNLQTGTVDRIFSDALEQLIAFLRVQRHEGGQLRTTLAHLFFSLEVVTTLLSERLAEIHEKDPRLPAMIVALSKTSLVLSRVAGSAFYEVRSEEMQEALRIASSLLETSHELNARTDSVFAVLGKLTRIVQRLVRCDLGFALLWNEAEAAYVIEAGSGLSAAGLEELKSYRFHRNDYPVMADVFDGKLVAHQRGDGSVSAEFMERYGQSAYAVAPMTSSQGQRLGSLVACRSEPVPFTPSDLEILRGIAQNAALAIENAMLVEKLAQASRVKSDFINSMSHEIRTPLHVVVGYVDILRDRWQNDPESVALLDYMQSNTGYLIKLVNSVLDVARMEAGQMPLQIETFPAEEILTSLRQMFSPSSLKHGVEFSCRSCGVLPSLTTDRMKLLEILSNLVANAFKFTDSGSVTVMAACGDDARIRFDVTDTGLGIDPGVVHTIFDVFRQVGPSNRGGTGLGLYIVKRLTGLLGGEVNVESEPGRGSTFRVQIPLSAPAATVSG